MANPFQEGDDLKNKYLEKSLHANDEAMSGAKFTDLMNKDSSVYKDEKVEPVKEPEIPEVPKTDAEGFPIISPVHTYKADLTGIINEDKLSLSRIAMIQSGKTTNETKDPKISKNRIYAVLGVLLVVLGVGIIGVIAFLNNENNTPVEVPVKEKYLIFAEKIETYDISSSTKTEIAAFIKTGVSKLREEDLIMEIVPTFKDESKTEYRAGVKDFLSKVNSRMPDDLYRSLYDRFFLGLYSKKGVTNPFFVIYTNSYDIAYPALLKWEGFMQDDFNWFFDARNQTSTTTEKLTFKDRVISNRDVRSLEDSAGRTAFFYTFLDNNTILFARTTDTVRKVVDRIREAKFQ